ncbi:thaumatin family protein [Streptomyces mirabilis]|uniref:thaumatin family protein n=1 Tax=Streptomyces mirabilis TaxID=68239 RepID=UPI0033B1B5B8
MAVVPLVSDHADNWGGGIWGRTGWTGTAVGPCGSGDCTSVRNGGNPPTPLGEFTFDVHASMDFYDVSMVDGSNLPIWINISHTTTTDPVRSSGCYTSTRTTNVDCSKGMQALSGCEEIDCKLLRAAFGGDTYCCRGAWAGRDNCVPRQVAGRPHPGLQAGRAVRVLVRLRRHGDDALQWACYSRVTFGTTAGGT